MVVTRDVDVVLVSGHYSLRMLLSSPVVSQGDSVRITCDVHQKHDAGPATLVFVKKLDNDQHVKIASNHLVEQLYQQTARYRIERNDSHALRRVRYTLTISRMSVSAAHFTLSSSLTLMFIATVTVSLPAASRTA